MASHPIDMATIGSGFATEEMRSVWDEDNRTRSQLRVEAALALTEAELGIIPQDAAQAIAQAAQAPVDVQRLKAAGEISKHSLNATVQALQQRAGSAGEWVHWGATTQDIVDTGMILQIVSSLDLIEPSVRRIATALARLASEYKATPMPGRTHFIQAVPTTFGFVVAVWLDEFLRHIDRLRRAREVISVGNLNGAVGTFSAFGSQGTAVQDGTLRRLGLASPRISWQSSPDRVGEYGATLTLVSTTLGKIATELALLMHTEIGEVAEPFSTGEIGSTTMPQKRNPTLLEGAATLTSATKSAYRLILDAQGTIHQRDAISWRAAWLGVPELHLYLSAQLAAVETALDGLSVYPDRMAENLNRQHGLIMSEHAMFELGRYVGKQSAHAIVYRAAMSAEETGASFLDELVSQPEVAAHFSRSEVASWLRPDTYLGDAVPNVDRVLAAASAAGIG